ncbi:hypothetical protein [uncultured Methanoculleus sp.]|uniref:hypothetical protein n=1 Tax=uncultured Methanoculleus sp. TaxID=183762 RepID=UPI00320480A6
MIRKSGASEAEKVALLDEAFLGLGTRVVRAGDGITADDVLDLVGDNTKTLTPTEILGVVKRDTTTVWLEEGFQEGVKKGFGWIHIKKKHITGEVPDGDLFPTSMTEDEIKNLIYDSVRYGVPENAGGGRIAYIYPVGDGRDMRTIVDPNRGIITSYPVGE